MASAPWIVSDELWSRIEPLLPRVERRFQRLHELLLPELRAAGEIEWARAVADLSHVQARLFCERSLSRARVS